MKCWYRWVCKGNELYREWCIKDALRYPPKSPIRMIVALQGMKYQSGRQDDDSKLPN